jgi:hypothetical protein
MIFPQSFVKLCLFLSGVSLVTPAPQIHARQAPPTNPYSTVSLVSNCFTFKIALLSVGIIPILKF